MIVCILISEGAITDAKNVCTHVLSNEIVLINVCLALHATNYNGSVKTNKG